MKVLLLLSLLINPILGFAQSNQDSRKDFYEQLRKQMEEDRKLMEKYFKGDFLKRFDKMFKGLDSDFFDQMDDMMNDDSLSDFMKGFQIPGGDIENYWKEDKNTRTLILKVTPKKDSPFDIKIENSTLSIKGTVEKRQEWKGKSGSSYSTRIYTFQKAFPIPSDVDPASASFEQKKDEIRVTFTKLGKKRPTTPKAQSKVPVKPKKRDDGSVPLKPQKGDVAI